MELYPFLKGLVDADRCAVVICSLKHEIIYMNPAAEENYVKWGGGKLVGKSLLDCHNDDSCRKIEKVAAWFLESKEHNRVYTFHNDRQNKDVYMVALRDESGRCIGYYEKHEYRNAEQAEFYQELEED